MVTPMRRLSVSIDPNPYNRLLTHAQAAERSIAAQVRFILNEYLALVAGDHPTLTLTAYTALDSMSEELWALRRKVDQLSTPPQPPQPNPPDSA